MTDEEVLKEIAHLGKTDPIEGGSIKNPHAGKAGEEITPVKYPEAYLLGLILKLDKTSMDVYLSEVKSEYFSDPLILKIYEQLKIDYVQKGFEIKDFYDKLQHVYPETNSLFERIYLQDQDKIEGDLLLLQKELTASIKRIKKSYFTKKLLEITRLLKHAEAEKNHKKIDQLMNEADLIRESLNLLDS